MNGSLLPNFFHISISYLFNFELRSMAWNLEPRAGKVSFGAHSGSFGVLLSVAVW